jgi:hypothetical protein
MRKFVFTLMCAILFLQAIPMVSAQAQVPPPNYSFNCTSQETGSSLEINMDVDPETSKLPREIMDCVITNDESYSLELSISSEDEDFSVEHDDSIVVGANGEETFQVTIEAKDRMAEGYRQVKIWTEVTKTGELDYSDDEPKYFANIVQIMQYAAFTFEPQQADNNQKLTDDEYFEASYILTNEGNGRDMFSIRTNSFATPICDEDKPVETGSGASGCVLTTPVSDSCEEELTIFWKNKNGEDYEQINVRREMDPDESYTITWTVSSNIGKASCWPTDSDGNYHLEFTHEVSASSQFASQNSDWDELVGYDHSPISIERTVDVTQSNDEGIISSVVPGFESSYLLLCVFFAAIIHNRKNGFY